MTWCAVTTLLWPSNGAANTCRATTTLPRLAASPCAHYTPSQRTYMRHLNSSLDGCRQNWAPRNPSAAGVRRRSKRRASKAAGGRFLRITAFLFTGCIAEQFKTHGTGRTLPPMHTQAGTTWSAHLSLPATYRASVLNISGAFLLSDAGGAVSHLLLPLCRTKTVGGRFPLPALWLFTAQHRVACLDTASAGTSAPSGCRVALLPAWTRWLRDKRGSATFAPSPATQAPPHQPPHHPLRTRAPTHDITLIPRLTTSRQPTSSLGRRHCIQDNGNMFELAPADLSGRQALCFCKIA